MLCWHLLDKIVLRETLPPAKWYLAKSCALFICSICDLKILSTSFVSTKQNKQFCLCFFDLEAHRSLRFFECLTNFVTFQDKLVKRLCKLNCCFVQDKSVLLDTNYVFNSWSLEDSPNIDGITCCKEDKLKVVLDLWKKIFKLRWWNQLTSTFFIFKQ